MANRSLDALMAAAQHDHRHATDFLAIGSTCRAARHDTDLWHALVHAACGRKQRTVLMHAAHSSDVARVRWLCEQCRAPLEARDSDGHTALYWAATCPGSSDVVRELLKQGAEVDAWSFCDDDDFCTDCYQTPLHEAASRVDPAGSDVVRVLLEYDADVDAIEAEGEPGCGHTALHLAALRNIANVARVLLQYHADVNALNSNMDAPLYYCISNGSVDVARLLLAHGADINAGMRSMLGLAARHCNLEMAQMLLDADADVNEFDVDGKTALDLVGILDFGRPSLRPREPLTALLQAWGGIKGADLP
jgi:ankyrin repeat protein